MTGAIFANSILLTNFGEFMENSAPGHRKPVETALIEAGFRVEEVVKQGKRTVITVTRQSQKDFEEPAIIGTVCKKVSGGMKKR